jgi:hypothetical protein
MKNPWRRKPKINGMRPDFIILDEISEYSNLDRMDGLEESVQRHPANAEPRGWYDSHYYEEKYGRKK